MKVGAVHAIRALRTSLFVTPVSQRPRTPIRWLCLRAFSYLGEVESRSLDGERLDQLCRAMELGIFLNRCFDGKRPFSSGRYRELRRPLDGRSTREYLRRLKSLEASQPASQNWKAVFQYRRDVLEISLRYLFNLSGIRQRDVLLPICSMVQLVDDVLDQKTDRKLGLPTFVTADGPSASQLARMFWQELRTGREPEEMPFVVSGWLVYLLARFTILCFKA